jgi:hypothetical protein
MEKIPAGLSDPLFAQPFIDLDEQRQQPVPHHYVHGGFAGTGTRFSFYFPPKEKYQGRFFQYITPFPDNENLSQGAAGEEDKIGFAIASGAYFVETNGGGSTDFTQPGFQNDPTVGAYRANAAAAQYSRVVAMQLLGGGRPYGYAFGGSGGAYRTIGGIENTLGVWDGVVPYVLGSPMAIPNVFCVRMHAMRILKDKIPHIIDALEPGGSGDIYAGLNGEEKEALQEVTRMGFPPKSWFGYQTMGIHGFLVLYQGVVMADNAYFTQDFWQKPGYLGANPPASLRKARLQKSSQIKAGITLDQAIACGLAEPVSAQARGSADLAWKSLGGVEGEMPAAFQLTDRLPDVDFIGGDLIIKSGEAAGMTLQLTRVDGDKVALGPTNSPALLLKLKAGDEVVVDNSNFLAVQTYHRHQVPGKEYAVWDQFRDETGSPVYPQRPLLLGPLFTLNAAGSLPTGKFEGKMILLGSLLDREAFPWQCDWYRARVQEHLGERAGDHFRLWYTEHALHGDQAGQLEDPTHAVSYLGVLQQALRDLSAWVEQGVEPPASTNYRVVDGQIQIPPTAAERHGIQPVVTLRANGAEKAGVKTGEAVVLEGTISVPPGMGRVIWAGFDLDGSGSFATPATLEPADETCAAARVRLATPFARPGTYFVTLRAASSRSASPSEPFAQIKNLARVRITVE